MEQDIRNILQSLHGTILRIDGQLKSVKAREANEEIEAYKTSLYQYYFNEKGNALNHIYHILDVHFKNAITYEINILMTFGDAEGVEHAKEAAITSMVFNGEELAELEALRSGQPVGDDFAALAMGELNRLAALDAAIRHRAQMAQMDAYNLRAKIAQTIPAIEKPATEKKSVERYIGLNILNAVGVLLFIIGAVAAVRLGYTWAGFVLGGIFLVGGEVINRRKAGIFSLGLTAGGLGISYATLAISHFVQGSISIFPLLIIGLAISVLAFYLATRYKSQTLLAITLAGGHIPIFIILIDFNHMALEGMLIYLAVFNFMALIAAMYNNWPVLAGVSALFGWYLFFGVMFQTDVWRFAGIAAAILAVVYGLLSLLATRNKSAKALPVVLLVAAGCFVVAFVVIQMDYMWISPALAVLAAGLAIVGIVKDIRGLVISGVAVGGVAVAWLLTADMLVLLIRWPMNWFYITIQAATVTFAGVAVLVVLALRNQLETAAQKAYKYIVMVGTWLFGVFLAIRLVDDFAYQSPISTGYLGFSTIAIVTLIYAKILPKIPRLGGVGTDVMGWVFSIIGMLSIFTLSVFWRITTGYVTSYPEDIAAIAISILIVVKGFGLLAFWDIMRRALAKEKDGKRWMPIIAPAYFMVVFTATVVMDFGLGFYSFWISLVYIATALLWTIFGFVRNFAPLRRAGLVLALLSVGKLFLFDLHRLTEEFRVLSYFIMGGVLVAISFAYQYFSKRLDATAISEVDEALSKPGDE